MGEEEKGTRRPRPEDPFQGIQQYAYLRGFHSDELVEKLSRHQLIYSTLGLVLGLACVIGGVVLFFAGVTGRMSWTAKFLGASSEMLDAAPGAVLFVVGLFVVFVTRYMVKSSR